MNVIEIENSIRFFRRARERIEMIKPLTEDENTYGKEAEIMIHTKEGCYKTQN